jgi:hypothetical protein
MIKKAALSLSMFVLAATLLLSRPVLADTINLSLSNPVQSGAPGSTLSFTATVSAPVTNGATVYLNADSFNVDSPLTLNDDGFFLGFPLSLDAGDSFTGLLFTVTIPSDALAGLYNGSFEIMGGADGGAGDSLGTVAFLVNAESPVPEPGSFLLLGTGLAGGLAFAVYGRRNLGLKGMV